MTLTWLDYTVIAGYLVAITAFGSWTAGDWPGIAGKTLPVSYGR